MVFSSSHVGCEIWTIKKTENQKNWCCWIVVLEKTLESPLDWKEIKLVNPKGINSEYLLEGWCWGLSRNTLANWCEELINWKKPLCWERLKAGGEGDNRGWDGWMASPTQCTWVCVSSGSWWRTGEPGVLQSVGSQSWTWLNNWTDWQVMTEEIVSVLEG